MLLKFIGTLSIAVVVAVLTGFNLENKCDVWIFHEFNDIPVFYTILTAFIAGVIVTIFVQAFSSVDKEDEVKAKKFFKNKKGKIKEEEGDSLK